jgi:hypothetical protein
MKKTSSTFRLSPLNNLPSKTMSSNHLYTFYKVSIPTIFILTCIFFILYSYSSRMDVPENHHPVAFDPSSGVDLDTKIPSMFIPEKNGTLVDSESWAVARKTLRKWDSSPQRELSCAACESADYDYFGWVHLFSGSNGGPLCDFDVSTGCHTKAGMQLR